MDNLGTIIMATGALGTAAFGIVETLKWTPLGQFGFGAIVKTLGPVVGSLKEAYGPRAEDLLRAQYKGDRSDLARTIRQGARVGLNEENAGPMAEFVGVVAPDQLQEVARLVRAGKDLPESLQNILARFELALDARIDAAMTLAQNHYVAAMRIAASCISILIAVIMGLVLSQKTPGPDIYLLQSIVVGLAAVPIAPVAKDLVSAIQSARVAVGTRP